jgi:hypothetical protein
VLIKSHNNLGDTNGLSKKIIDIHRPNFVISIISLRDSDVQKKVLHLVRFYFDIKQ